MTCLKDIEARVA